MAGDGIPNKFAEVYQELFNREKDQDTIAKISVDIEEGLGQNAFDEIDKINFRTIGEALGKIK